MIYFSNRQRRVPVDRDLVARAAQAALEAEGAGRLDLSVTVVSDRAICGLNRRFLGHEGATDVLSFPLGRPSDPDGLLGEVVVSADRALAEAESRRLALPEELLRYVVHGTLHLLGHDDREPRARARMRRKQEAILRILRGRPREVGRPVWPPAPAWGGDGRGKRQGCACGSVGRRAARGTSALRRAASLRASRPA